MKWLIAVLMMVLTTFVGQAQSSKVYSMMVPYNLILTNNTGATNLGSSYITHRVTTNRPSVQYRLVSSSTNITTAGNGSTLNLLNIVPIPTKIVTAYSNAASAINGGGYVGRVVFSATGSSATATNPVQMVFTPCWDGETEDNSATPWVVTSTVLGASEQWTSSQLDVVRLGWVGCKAIKLRSVLFTGSAPDPSTCTITSVKFIGTGYDN